MYLYFKSIPHETTKTSTVSNPQYSRNFYFIMLLSKSIKAYRYELECKSFSVYFLEN